MPGSIRKICYSDIDDHILSERLLAVLTEPERKIMILYYYEGKTCKEIGEICDRTQQRIDYIRHQALIKMKICIDRWNRHDAQSTQETE